MSQPCGHEGKPPYIKGLCRRCYQSAWARTIKGKAAKKRARAAWLARQRTSGVLMSNALSIPGRVRAQTSCQICGASDVPLVLDHRHGTKVARGRLCATCNIGLGFVEKAVETGLLVKMVVYATRR